jgi:hypothetical protein
MFFSDIESNSLFINHYQESVFFRRQIAAVAAATAA